MKKFLLFVVAATFFVNAMAPAPEAKTIEAMKSATLQDLVVDNFDDADITVAPNWWKFDRLQVTFPEATDKQYGLYTIKVTGKAESYYVGGMGTYFGKDVSAYDTFALDVYGNGPASGTIKVQLLDDDNNTFQVEQDSKYEPMADDRLEYELPVTWTGWKTVEIPLNKFVDTNPGIGDDVFNPDQANGSGGLLHVQLVFVATSDKGTITIGLDNLRFVKK